MEDFETSQSESEPGTPKWRLQMLKALLGGKTYYASEDKAINITSFLEGIHTINIIHGKYSSTFNLTKGEIDQRKTQRGQMQNTDFETLLDKFLTEELKKKKANELNSTNPQTPKTIPQNTFPVDSEDLKFEAGNEEIQPMTISDDDTIPPAQKSGVRKNLLKALKRMGLID